MKTSSALGYWHAIMVPYILIDILEITEGVEFKILLWF